VPVDVLVEVAGRLFRCLHCKFGLIICHRMYSPAQVCQKLRFAITPQGRGAESVLIFFANNNEPEKSVVA